MSEINKLDNKQCPFDSEQYKVKVNDTVAPVGSYPWAMIQVYLGKKVYRSNWNFPVEYTRLAGVPDDSPYIEKYNSGNSTHWQPTQKDMLACDWNLMDCLLSFDLTSGTEISSYFGNVGWGYISERLVGWPRTMGALNISPNNEIDITEITSFSWGERSNTFYINTSTKQDKESYQNVGFLFQNKELRVIVNNESYNLGKAQLGHHEGDGPYDYEFSYQNSEAQKLGALLQQMQQTGQIKLFCLNWVDK